MKYKCITVINKTYDDLNKSSDKLIDFIYNLQSVLETVPEEYKKDVMIELINENDYDELYNIVISIYYFRPETEAEKNYRIKKEIMIENDKKEKEIKMYHELKAKYEKR